MQVQIIHEDSNGAKTDFGMRELEHMPPVAEPFAIDRRTYYMAKAYFGPDERGQYLLILEGPPRMLE